MSLCQVGPPQICRQLEWFPFRKKSRNGGPIQLPWGRALIPNKKLKIGHAGFFLLFNALYI